MKNMLLLACATIVLAIGASAAQGEDNRYYDDRYYDDGYYNNGHDNWQYQYQDYGNYGDNPRKHNWNNGGNDYRQGAVSRRSIVRNLERNDYRSISQPVLSGRFYQVKAINADGRKVKLYIDRYSGRIVKVKGRG